MLKVISENNEVKTPYNKAKELWDSRMGNAKTQAYTWRLIAFLLIALLGISLLGNIYQSSQTKMIPYVIELKQNGDASALGTASVLTPKVHERATSFFLRRFVMLAREIPADAVLIKGNMLKIFQMVTTQGKSLLSEKFREANLLDEFKIKNRALRIASVLAVSKGVYQVDWFEAEYNKQGQKITEYPMRGTFKVALLEPNSENQIRENPLGIFIDFFSWTKLGGQ
ncbi:MAG: hypothetical protein KC505_06580 [Myxococcales bacterium]|nr:hypothetical protein [Myxococcales bacterium]